MPFFSICIPVYKNLEYLKRVIDSIFSQTFTDYEVIITDDSPDNAIEEWLKLNYNQRDIRYYKNPQALGTPENWNEGIRQAKGEWIKLMHDDDWFACSAALDHFQRAIIQNPGCSFFFSAYENIVEETGKAEVVRMTRWDKWLLRKSKYNLFKKVYVGNPSCTVVHNKLGLFYDKQYKFVVDFEYYIRVINKTGSWNYLDKILLNVGFNNKQVTSYTKYNPDIQLPENHQLIRQMGEGILSNVLVYDYYWRMYRNLNMRSIEQVKSFDSKAIPETLQKLIRFQINIHQGLLKKGFFSKSFMLISYLKNLIVKNEPTY